MTDGTGLHAEITGDPRAAPPVIFLHGFGGSAGVWRSVAAAVGKSHPTIAYDLPGHAGSIGADGIGGGGRMAKALLADIAARGVKRRHLVGHSMGGAVAALMALRDRESAASLTLLAPGGFGPEINIRLLARFAAAANDDTMLPVLENMFGWNKTVPADYLARVVALRRQPGAVEALQAIIPAMTTGEGEERRQGMIARADLASLTMPVKVLWGTQDRVLPTRQSHRLPPRFAAHVFEDTGHMLIEEQRDAVIDLVAENIRAGSREGSEAFSPSRPVPC